MPSFDFLSPEQLDKNISALIADVGTDADKDEVALIEKTRTELQKLYDIRFTKLQITNRLKAIEAELAAINANPAPLSEANTKKAKSLTTENKYLANTFAELISGNVRFRAPLTELDISKRLTGLMLSIHDSIECRGLLGSRNKLTAQKSKLYNGIYAALGLTDVAADSVSFGDQKQVNSEIAKLTTDLAQHKANRLAISAQQTALKKQASQLAAVQADTKKSIEIKLVALEAQRKAFEQLEALETQKRTRLLSVKDALAAYADHQSPAEKARLQRFMDAKVQYTDFTRGITRGEVAFAKIGPSVQKQLNAEIRGFDKAYLYDSALPEGIDAVKLDGVTHSAKVVEEAPAAPTSFLGSFFSSSAKKPVATKPSLLKSTFTFGEEIADAKAAEAKAAATDATAEEASRPAARV